MSVPTQQLPSEPACRRLVQFYELQGADNRGRRLQQIIEWSDNRLESCHDYIQTLFPLPEESMFADAPVIDEETYLYWRRHASLRQNLRRAFERILTFYGFEISWDEADGGGADRKPHISEKRGARSNLARWVRPMDHNHLRITRILRSLRVLGMEAEAREFHQALSSVCQKYGIVGGTSQKFWRRAMEFPLHVAPDGTEVDWLEKYEAAVDASEDEQDTSDEASAQEQNTTDREGNTR
ncbi:hypothetical protein TruAng_000348 [Truncatella angustata]|nr:hypothetical protein TruAng_000348 [Truncatella angustata]